MKSDCSILVRSYCSSERVPKRTESHQYSSQHNTTKIESTRERYREVVWYIRNRNRRDSKTRVRNSFCMIPTTKPSSVGGIVASWSCGNWRKRNRYLQGGELSHQSIWIECFWGYCNRRQVLPGEYSRSVHSGWFVKRDSRCCWFCENSMNRHQWTRCMIHDIHWGDWEYFRSWNWIVKIVWLSCVTIETGSWYSRKFWNIISGTSTAHCETNQRRWMIPCCNKTHHR